MRDRISLIIPTYKRPEKLRRLLRSLGKQTLKEFEILVIDNDPNPKTRMVVAAFNRRATTRARYIREPRLGLHNSRHTGAKKASGDILVLTEDEATYHPRWLESYHNAFIAHPQMAAAGGPIVPKWEGKPPQWLGDLIGSSNTFSPLSLMKLSHGFRVSKRGFFYGGNMAIRKKILFDLGGFNPEIFDRLWLGDGETGLNRKLWKKNLRIGYIPGALMYHHIEREKMTMEFFRLRLANQGRCDMYTLLHERGIPENVFGVLTFLPDLLAIHIRHAIKTYLLGYRAPMGIKLSLQITRLRAQVAYMQQAMHDPKLQQLIRKKHWLT